LRPRRAPAIALAVKKFLDFCDFGHKARLVGWLLIGSLPLARWRLVPQSGPVHVCTSSFLRKLAVSGTPPVSSRAGVETVPTLRSSRRTVLAASRSIAYHEQHLCRLISHQSHIPGLTLPFSLATMFDVNIGCGGFVICLHPSRAVRDAGTFDRHRKAPLQGSG
jgi:hypothetical protein